MIIGLIFIIAPFFIIFQHPDKKLAFVYVFSFWITLHLLIAVVTQALHLFTYPVVLGIHAVIFSIVLLKVDWGGGRISGLMRHGAKKIDWVLLIVVLIAFMHLYRVHYDYTGKYTVVTTPEYQEASHMRYPYPYFADEWYAIAFIKDSLNSHALPFRDPLDLHHTPFANFEFAFHSLLSEFILLLGLNPLTDYTLLTIFSGLLICLLVYLFLTFDGVNRLPAAIAALAVLYITNGANLPGIWTLIPLVAGIVCLLLSLFFFVAGHKAMVWFMAVLTLLFYPPLFPFYASAVVFWLGAEKKLPFQERSRDAMRYLIVMAVAGAALLTPVFAAKGAMAGTAWGLVLRKIFPPTFPPDSIAHLAIWHIVPVPIIILSIAGVLMIMRHRQWLAAMVLLGLAYWAVYSQTTYRFILDYPRVVVATAILLTLVSGYGLNWLVETLKRSRLFNTNKNLTYIQTGILIIFLLASGHYTQRENWRNLKLSHRGLNKTFEPAAPANRYLHPDDLRIFEHIKGKRVKSIPWKATVVGVATDNYARPIKPGTLSSGGSGRVLGPVSAAMCAKEYKATATATEDRYWYLPWVDCPHFEIVDRSAEGFYLLKFKK